MYRETIPIDRRDIDGTCKYIDEQDFDDLDDDFNSKENEYDVVSEEVLKRQ